MLTDRDVSRCSQEGVDDDGHEGGVQTVHSRQTGQERVGQTWGGGGRGGCGHGGSSSAGKHSIIQNVLSASHACTQYAVSVYTSFQAKVQITNTSDSVN